MADKEIEPHQLDEDVKTDETEDTNQDENDCKMIFSDTNINSTANNDDAETQLQCEVEDPTKQPGLYTKNNPPTRNYDRGDCKNMKAQEETPISIHSEEKVDIAICDEADGPQEIKLNEESEDDSTAATEETSEKPALDDEGIFESESEIPKLLPQEAPALEKPVPDSGVETIGPTPSAESTPISDVPPTVKDDNGTKVWIAVLVAVVAVAALFAQRLQPESPLEEKDVHPIDIFHKEMEKVKVQFPNQREDLWKRSRIHLERHFLISQPSEPVSLILTAGVRAEGTLRCLARSIASALSTALNASALHLEGTGKSSLDSDMVKSDIDSQLQKAFEGGKPIAVVHRFEELPPASTLIFYRYCDHENAAFKKTFLIFTVLLEEEDEIQAKIRLSEVEEMVTDHLQKKFLSHSHPAAFDKMDMDKYSGLWSRISHLILPVATEQRIEKTGHC